MQVRTERRLLIVGNDPFVAESLRAILPTALDVVSVNNGADALDLCQHNSFDAVLLDVELPGMDGYEVCRRLRAMPKAAEVQVIFHSSHAGLVERLKGYAVGADDYLHKPVEPAELRAKVSHAIAQRARLRTLASRLDEMRRDVQGAAEIVGDTDVMLEFQHDARRCTTYQELAVRLFEALRRFQLEGCIALEGSFGSCLANANGAASALEVSILTRLDAIPGDGKVHGVGPHAACRQDGVLLFIRELAVERPAQPRQASLPRRDRLIDHVALLTHSSAARVAAIDARQTLGVLADMRALTQTVRGALLDISAQGPARRARTLQLFEQLIAAIETSFITLGLSGSQEDELSEILRRHQRQVSTLLAGGLDTDRRLAAVIAQLGSH